MLALWLVLSCLVALRNKEFVARADGHREHAPPDRMQELQHADAASYLCMYRTCGVIAAAPAASPAVCPCRTCTTADAAQCSARVPTMECQAIRTGRGLKGYPYPAVFLHRTHAPAVIPSQPTARLTSTPGKAAHVPCRRDRLAATCTCTLTITTYHDWS